MNQSELLIHLCRQLEHAQLRYLITGSQATTAFGEPRFTNDIDVVVDLEPCKLNVFCDGFPTDDYSLSREAARQAVAERRMFNIIHPRSGLKIDVVISGETEFDLLCLNRGVRIPIADDCEAVFTSPEDIILKKLQWHHMGGGERHLRDIAGVIRVQGEKLDAVYIEEQAKKLGVGDLWSRMSGTSES
jgi:hypothetical protein